MKECRKICIIGGGVVEIMGNNFYGKAPIVEYLHELAGIFGRVEFVTHMEETHNYVSRINPDLVNVTVLKRSGQDTGYLDLIYDFKRHLQVLGRILDKNTGVILTNLTVGGLGMMLIAKIYAGRIVLYLGSDPHLTAKLKSDDFKGRIKRFALALSFPLTALLSNGILARGNACFSQSKRWNKNVMQSQPLILFTKFRNTVPKSRSGKTTDSHVHFLYVGKLARNKGVDLLLDAFTLLTKRDKTPARLTIAGNGVEANSLVKKASENGISNIIRFTGYIDDGGRLIDLYQECDALIVPSTTAEGFPRVIDEAMACGVPVICSRLGGMGSGLDDDDVIFVAPGSIDDLYNSMRRFSTDVQLQFRLKKRSRDRAARIMSLTAAEQHSQFLLHEPQRTHSAPADAAKSNTRLMIITERPTHYRVDLYNLLSARLGGSMTFCFISNQKFALRDVISVLKNEAFLNHSFIFSQGPIILRNLKALYRVFRLNPDVIINVGLSLRTVFLLSFAKLRGKKLVTWWGGTKASENHTHHVHTLYRKFLIRQLDGFIAYSELSDEHLRHLVPRLKSPLILGNNPLDSSRFHRKVDYFKKNRPRDDKILRIITVAFLIDRKNIIMLLRVYKRLSYKFDFLQLIIVGDGPALKTLKRYAEVNNLVSVVFKGFVPPEKMFEEYAGADIYVLPSLLDRWPQTFNEAASAGLPVLVSNSSAVVNMYTKAFGNEVTFGSNDLNRLESLLIELINNPNRRELLGAKALESALQNDCEKAVNRIITYVSNL